MSHYGDDKPDWFLTLWMGMIIGAGILGIIFALIFGSTQFISKDTADDICQQLTDNPGAIGHGFQKKLICEIPSYDSTQNIIVRSNDEDN